MVPSALDVLICPKGAGSGKSEKFETCCHALTMPLEGDQPVVQHGTLTLEVAPPHRRSWVHSGATVNTWGADNMSPKKWPWARSEEDARVHAGQEHVIPVTR